MAIEVLSQDVVNQIAAGEVLERPANLVKELIENSLDANATEIEIDLDLGGRYVKIQDNGHGMNQKDLLLAMGRHATSKIKKFSDLWSLSSYGFRGEALASTAAVSKMKITTRSSESNEAYQITSNYGKQSAIESVSGTFGTRIIIEDLFENVPARLKFLKSESAEITQILKVVKAFALSHPNVTFRIKQKNILKLFYPATSLLLERAKTVLGIDELFEVQQNYGGFQVHAIFSSPKVIAKTSQQLWVFVQKRWVQDRGLQKAIFDAYRNLLMHGEYPYCAIFIECNPQAVDVNIHPTKSQVKFQDASLAFRAVHNTLRGALERGPWLQKLFSEDLSVNETYSQTETRSVQKAIENFSNYSQNHFATEKISFSQTIYPQKKFDGVFAIQAKPEMTDTIEASNDNFDRSSTQGLAWGGQLWGNLQVLGQLNLTYILAQSRQALFLVDQHAAHERVVFERLMKNFSENKLEVQNFLLPLQMNLEPDAFEALITLSNELKKMSLEIEPAGPNTISVNAAPAIVKEKALLEVLQKIAHESLTSGGSYSLEKKIGDIFASMACHSVIRAGQALSNEEMKELLTQMDESPLSSFCPHGRPVFKQILLRDLDKEFGRIV